MAPADKNKPLGLIEGLRGLANAEHSDYTFASWAADELEAAISNREHETRAKVKAEAQRDELLAALKDVMDYQGGAESPLHDEYVVDRIRAAIAKAEGR